MAPLDQVLGGTHWIFKRIPSAIFVFRPVSWIRRDIASTHLSGCGYSSIFWQSICVSHWFF